MHGICRCKDLQLPSYHLPQCSRHIMSLLVLFVPSYHLLPQCSLCSVTHRTICRNAAVTLCPSLSCSYPRSIHIMSLVVLFVPSFHSCRNAAFVLSLIVPSAAMQPSRYVSPCPFRTLVQSSAAMQPLFCHSSYYLPQCSRHVMSLLVLFLPSYHPHYVPRCPGRTLVPSSAAM
jgi:hypothetical protein